MKALFIGGTGIISTACTQLALQRGWQVTLLNRGQHAAASPVADGPAPEVLLADINKPDEVARVLAGRTFDVVANFIAFNPAHIERDLALFAGKTGQYVFISSASVYQKPLTHYRVTESTPLANPYWQYSRDKIACEERLLAAYRTSGFPITIVRPSLTYGDTMIPLAISSWNRPWTIVARMLAGQQVIVPGDGSSLWTITHNTDFAKGFVGLMGHAQALGHAFHITGDEVLTWDQCYQIVAQAAGAEARITHIASDLLAAYDPDLKGGLHGDKAVSTVLDNAKIKSFVPGFVATTSFRQGMQRTVARFRAEPSWQDIDEPFNAWCDRVLASYRRAWPEGG